jgi:F0F1-type ATP synthase assembly protein I
MTDEIPEWQQRLDERMAAFKAKKAAQKAERAKLKRRRAYGKAIHHAARLAANRTES